MKIGLSRSGILNKGLRAIFAIMIILTASLAYNALSVSSIQLSNAATKVFKEVQVVPGFDSGYLNYTVCNPSPEAFSTEESDFATTTKPIKGEYLEHKYYLFGEVPETKVRLIPSTISKHECFEDLNTSEEICQDVADTVYEEEPYTVNKNILVPFREQISLEKGNCFNLVSFYTYNPPISAPFVIDDIQSAYGLEASHFAILNVSYNGNLNFNNSLSTTYLSANDSYNYVNITGIFYVNGTVLPNSTGSLSDIAVHNSKLFPFQILNLTKRGNNYSAILIANMNSSNGSISWNSTVLNINVSNPFGLPVIGFWMFEDSVNSSDLSTQNAPVTISNVSQSLVASSKFGRALQDDSALDDGGVMVVNPAFKSMTNFTICADITFKTANVSGFFLGMDGCSASSGWYWYYQTAGDGTFYFGTRGDSDTYGGTVSGISLNKLFRICTTYDKYKSGTNKFIYVNGTQRLAYDSDNAWIPCNNNEFSIGFSSNPNFNNDDATGIIDNIILYNVSLTADQVKRDYELFSTGLTSYFPSTLESDFPNGTTDEQANAAIETAIANQVPSAIKYPSQKVYLVNASGSQWQGTVNYLVMQNSPPRRWVFNYITANESYLGAPNLSNVVYILEMTNKSYIQILAEVSNMLVATKG